MRLINFHTEHPATQDVFPGGSHDKVASAIHRHLLSDGPSKVVGLDGEFGSGKSSILSMLKVKLTAADSDFRVWFFDCEQNYQGSTKSNFIELFTDEVLKEVPHVSRAAETLKASRDRALGRLFEYNKRTTSRVSVWALALIASLFFAATSFRELFALSRSSHAAITGTTPEAAALTNTLQDPFWWLIGVHLLSFCSPMLILGAAKLWHRKVRVGTQKWSLLSLFKGSSDDHIQEKVEVGKEVTPLDLKKTLLEQLKVVEDKRFVIILDNLDRLPKDSLRSVWSDLEIFIEVATHAANLTVIVPFCSNKVAEYLKADGDRRYEARDFIAKKFPVVFRSPPVITSGWKDGFRQLWNHSFPDGDGNVIEQCAQLLQRHSPMANNLVTPRLQKKFINDIATTALVVGEDISLLAIASHLLLCKYADFSLVEMLRTGGLSETYQKEIGQEQAGLVKETRALLGATLGASMETGWQIQFLQIHYLTTGDIAIAELLDTPLAAAFAQEDSDALGELTSLFGFSDAMKRLLSQRPSLASLLPTISQAHQAREGDWIGPLLALLNSAQLELFEESKTGAEKFYEAVRYCRGHGLKGQLLSAHGGHLKTSLLKILNAAFDPDQLTPAWELMQEYDHYLQAQGLEFEAVVVKRCEYVMHLLPDIALLKVIKASGFTFADAGLPEAHVQLASCADHPMGVAVLPTDCVVPALEWLYGARKFGGVMTGGISASDVASLAKFTGAAGEVESAVLGLGLAANVDPVIGNAITTLLANNASPLIKAVAAVTYIRQVDPDSLAELDDLDGVFESSVFRALANASLTTSALFQLVADSKVGESVAAYLAYLIREERIARLNCSWVTTNFSVITQALAKVGLSEAEIALWLIDWDDPIAEASKDALKADVRLINVVMEADENVLPKTREGLLKQLTSKERTCDEWVQTISAGAKQHQAILNGIVSNQEPIQSIAAVGDALVNVLNSLASGTVTSPWGAPQYAMMDSLLSLLDAQQRNVIGIRLRKMLFAESVEPDDFAIPLSKYGHLIPDVQPSNPQEVQRIVLFLAYLSRNPDSLPALAKFFDAKAEQIAAFKYSTELRSTMGEAVAKLSDITPALYKKFAQTKGFIRLIQSLTRAARDPEPEQDT
ncbi:KAP family NTPase [Pseudomonas sp. S07E 245]|uniref:P-loop NTPase fold protein n=1 Tax=Pseudomonas sp. S07E 245 TaxID=2866278 RepID=UPI001C733B29|nr:P-loop NTPase fold protein [Pseudomonas sp. S07E 245]QYX50465.1 KAP family NTPase [Pseudomonas sp. S07E 245]